MSLFGAMNTAISGLTAQSAAFGNIGDNVANSQTTGYKEVETSFVDYLTTSTATVNDPGAVVALPQLHQQRAGHHHPERRSAGAGDLRPGLLRGVASRPDRSTTPRPSTRSTSIPRAGDFQLNDSGYLVNSAGQYLHGWTVNPATGVVNQTSLMPIQITQTLFNPVPTTNVTLSANLPATPARPATAASPISSDIDVYDALGTQHVITLNWAQNAQRLDSDGHFAGRHFRHAACSAPPRCSSARSATALPAGTIGQLRHAHRQRHHRRPTPRANRARHRPRSAAPPISAAATRRST